MHESSSPDPWQQRPLPCLLQVSLDELCECKVHGVPLTGMTAGPSTARQE